MACTFTACGSGLSLPALDPLPNPCVLITLGFLLPALCVILQLVKLRQQTVAGQPLSETLRELGLRGLTRGTSATLLRDVPFNVGCACC